MPLSGLLKSSAGELQKELQLLLNAIVEGLCGIDAQGYITFCSEAMLRITGYHGAEAIGQNLHALIHKPLQSAAECAPAGCAFESAIHSAQPVHLVREFFWRKDGTRFPAECWIRPLLQLSGTTAYAVTLRDLTEIELAKDAVRENEEKFRRILTSIPDVAWTSDRSGRTVYISPKVEAIFGYTKREVCAGGANLWIGCIHPEDFGRVNRAYKALFDNHTPFNEEYRIRRKDGVWIWVHDRATGTREEKGELYADGILTDITQRKRVEAELRSKTAFLEAQANSTMEGILVVDSRGKTLMRNQRLIELFHVPPEISADEDDRHMLKHVLTLVQEPEVFLARVKHLNRNPSEISHDEIALNNGTILDRYAAPVIDKDGRYYGRIWTFRDITERKRNEDMLRQLSMAVEQSPVSVLITDSHGSISYVNEKFVECTGYNQDEVLGRNPRFLNAGFSSPDLFRDLWSNITQGLEWHGELCNKKKNGEIYWVSTSIRPITDAKGAIAHYLSIQDDITERRRKEREFRLTQFSLEHCSDAVEWVDSEGRLVYVNQAECDALGRSREEILSLSIPDIDPLVSKETWASFWSELKTAGGMNFESQRKSKQQIFPVQVTATYLPFDGQEYCFSLVSDITERKRAERELRMMKFSLENASDAGFWVDPKARIIYANGAACRSLGYSREELVTLSIPDIDPLFPRATWDSFWEKNKARGTLTFETQHKSKDGRVFPVEVTTNYLQFDGQEYSFAFAHDITERRALEGQLRQAQKLEGIGQLAAGIAHEINTPIQFVADNVTFLRDSWISAHQLVRRYRIEIRNAERLLPPGIVADLKEAERKCDLDFIVAEVPHAIDHALDGAQRVAKIVRAMKEFSHPDSGEKTATDLNKAIESTITVARNEWKYVAQVATELDENLPAVVCYPGDINQVILNLLVNAAHAIKEKMKEGEMGQITVCTRMRDEVVQISITDNGAGIPESIRTRVFDPFFTTKEVGKGTGQGLSLAHTVVVKKHSGKIWFESEIGRGTTFFIELPISPASPAKES